MNLAVAALRASLLMAFSASPAGSESFYSKQLARSDEGSLVRPVHLASDPSSYFNKVVWLRRSRCVAEPKGGFRCLINAGGRMLRIDASILGALTSVSTAQSLIDECKGTANIGRVKECTFDISFDPISSDRRTVRNDDGSNFELVTISARTIEIFPPSPTDEPMPLSSVAEHVAQSGIYSEDCPDLQDTPGSNLRLMKLNAVEAGEAYASSLRASRSRYQRIADRLPVKARCAKALEWYGPKGTRVPGLIQAE